MRRQAGVARPGWALLALLGVLLAAGCATSSSAGKTLTEGASEGAVPVIVSEPRLDLPSTVVDAAGHQVTVTDASRIVALNGGIAEILIGLGLKDNIVGREASADFPEVADVPLVSTGHDISAEGTLALHPTLVIGDTRSGPPQTTDAIRSAGVPVVLVPEVWSPADANPRIDAVAQAVGASAAATELTDFLADGVAAARPTKAPGATQPVVAFLYLRGTAAVYLLGGDGSGADDLIEAAGGIDAGTKLGLSNYTPLTPEALAAAAPDVILVMSKGLESVGGVEGLAAMPGVATTPAGRDRRIVSLPDGQLLSFGLRTPETLRELAASLP